MWCNEIIILMKIKMKIMIMKIIENVWKMIIM